MEAERMHSGMLLLAERLVIAMETMSQDVKNMSAYVFDISCCVTYLLNERREKESISVVSYDEGDYPSSAVSGQDEQADECPSSYVDPGNRDDSFVLMASTSIDPDGNSDTLSSESNLDFTGGIKKEVQFEVEVNNESRDVDDMFGNSGNSARISNEMISETLSETEEEDQACDLHTAISHSMEQLTRLESIATIEAASNPVPREFQCVNSLSDSAANTNRSAYMTSVPEAEPLVSRSRQIESAEEVLMVHTRMESKKEPFKCSVCKKSFKFNSDLGRHFRVHSGERPYKCNDCGKGFTRMSSLTLHMRTHTGERPYKCNVCGKAFSRNSILMRHMPSHTGQRPFSCDVCGKAFSRKSNLNIHIRTHTGQKPYRCNICEKAFTQKSNLNVHMRTHTGETP